MSKDFKELFSVVAGNVLSLVTTQDTSACIESTSNAIEGLSVAFGTAIDAITVNNTVSMGTAVAAGISGHCSPQDGALLGQNVAIQVKAKMGK